MRPKPRPIDDAQVIVYVDSNMPELRKCRRGCKSSPTHPCIHRFGPRIWVISESGRLSFTRQSDLQVILNFIYVIHRRWPGARSRKRFVIVTHDEAFPSAARTEHATNRTMQSLTLVWGVDWVQCSQGKHPIRIEIRHIPKGDRNTDLAEVLKISRTLRASC